MKKEAFAEGAAVKLTTTVASAPGAEEGRDGMDTQLGEAGVQGACNGAARIWSAPLATAGEVHVTEEASPNDGEIGKRTLNAVKVVGQETSTGEGALKEGRCGPPTPTGRATSVVGARHPVKLEKQLNGGGVFDGVGVRVEVYVATPEGDGGEEGEGGVDAEGEKLGVADVQAVCEF